MCNPRYIIQLELLEVRHSGEEGGPEIPFRYRSSPLLLVFPENTTDRRTTRQSSRSIRICARFLFPGEFLHELNEFPRIFERACKSEADPYNPFFFDETLKILVDGVGVSSMHSVR